MLILDGKPIAVPGLVGKSFLDDPKLVLNPNDWQQRTTGIGIRSLVIHTRMGVWPVKLVAGVGPNKGWDLVAAQRFAEDDRKASCHIAIDGDGSFACLADIIKIKTLHAGHVNDISVGIECFQEPDGTVYESTLDACVLICDVLTRVLGIQRQFATERTQCLRFANSVPGPTPATERAYLPHGGRARDYCGLMGHRNITRNRGLGDPGDDIWTKFKVAGYEGFAVDEDEDKKTWAQRQAQLGIEATEVDGWPGPLTRRYICSKRHGGPGLWVERPGDYDIAVVPAE